MVGHATIGPNDPVLKMVRDCVMARIPFMSIAGFRAGAAGGAWGGSPRQGSSSNSRKRKQNAFGGPRVAEQVQAQVLPAGTIA
jgi:hypothetical protein